MGAIVMCSFLIILALSVYIFANTKKGKKFFEEHE
jgi:hypothetical protein